MRSTARQNFTTGIIIAVFVLFWALPVIRAAGADEPPAPDPAGLLDQYHRAREEDIRDGQERYRLMSAPVVAAFRQRWGGLWWVVTFRDESRPAMVRGIIEGEYLLADAQAAADRGVVLKEGLRDLIYCCRKEFGAPSVAEDAWSWTVIFPQVLRGVPVDQASLRVRLLKEYRAADQAREQWNVEIDDVSLDLPADLDSRPHVTPEEAMRLFGESGVPDRELSGETVLIFCRERREEGPLRLCWQIEGKQGLHRLDAVTGEVLPEVDKTRSLR